MTNAVPQRLVVCNVSVSGLVREAEAVFLCLVSITFGLCL